MRSLLEQAEAAVRQNDWALLNQCLQQAIIAEQAEHLFEVIGRDRVLKMALAVLTAGDFQARWDVAKLFPQLGVNAALPLIELLQNEDADPEMRWFAARILGEFHTPASLQALVDVLEQTDDEHLSLVAVHALANQGSAAIAVLAQLLPHPNTRLMAVRCLTQIHQIEIIEPLLSVANDPHSEIRTLVIDALSSFPDPRVAELLLQGLADPVASVRRAAIAGLGGQQYIVEPQHLVECLSAQLFDLNLEVCQQAAIALGRLGGDAAAATLWRVLISPHTPVTLQLECVRSLGWIGSPMALSYLQQAIASKQISPTLYQEIIHVLGLWNNACLKPEVTQILLQTLAEYPTGNVNLTEKQAIALALGYLGEPQAIDSLIQLLAEEDASIRFHAIASLKMIDATVAYQQLIVLSQRANVPSSLQKGVAIALLEWG